MSTIIQRKRYLLYLYAHLFNSVCNIKLRLKRTKTDEFNAKISNQKFSEEWQGPSLGPTPNEEGSPPTPQPIVVFGHSTSSPFWQLAHWGRSGEKGAVKKPAAVGINSGVNCRALVAILIGTEGIFSQARTVHAPPQPLGWFRRHSVCGLYVTCVCPWSYIL